MNNINVIFFVLIDFKLHFTACKTTNETSTFGYYGNQLFKVPAQNQECVFPFKYKGKEYTSCTTNYVCTNCFWCGTEYYVTFGDGWGMCTESCLREKGMSRIYYKFFLTLFWLLFYT